MPQTALGLNCQPMRVLGIETSCDETGLAIYCSERGLLGQALHSQVKMHAEYGGVVPELASRDHLQRIAPLCSLALAEAGQSIGLGRAMRWSEIDALAYTQGPGLAGALLVGASVAQGLAWMLEKPLIGVHHLEGHILSPLLAEQKPEFPFLALLVSGGHTQLLAAHGLGQYELLGDSIDDAAGEAFDKSAKLLGLGYPGGPAIAHLAAEANQARQAGVLLPQVQLPRPLLKEGHLDFSFSGLKTAVLNQVNKARRGPAGLTHPFKMALAQELQSAIVDVLTGKSLAALRQSRLTQLVVAGGVSANLQLRQRLMQECSQRKIAVHFPPPSLCTDNGAMIALAGCHHLLAEEGAGRDWRKAPEWQAGQFDIKPRWPLETLRGQHQ
jgi:N6-L-threonylcarbamoyladenine synthase